ncbi:MAG TPA: SDR family oxidoreductase [Gemmatimonadales bacterium]|nr:SDR family oxidoreductase [Gemmatimonadales bacterium]
MLSGVRLTRHYLSGMLARNWGRVIFISSESAVQIPAEMIHYGVTKIAPVGLARGLAETTAGTGVGGDQRHGTARRWRRGAGRALRGGTR